MNPGNQKQEKKDKPSIVENNELPSEELRAPNAVNAVLRRSRYNKPNNTGEYFPSQRHKPPTQEERRYRLRNVVEPNPTTTPTTTRKTPVPLINTKINTKIKNPFPFTRQKYTVENSEIKEPTVSNDSNPIDPIDQNVPNNVHVQTQPAEKDSQAEKNTIETPKNVVELTPTPTLKTLVPTTDPKPNEKSVSLKIQQSTAFANTIYDCECYLNGQFYKCDCYNIDSSNHDQAGGKKYKKNKKSRKHKKIKKNKFKNSKRNSAKRI